MKRFVFYDYDFIVLSGVAFLFLISLASVIGDRKGAWSHTYNVNVVYDKDTKPEEIDRMYQQAHTRIRKDLAERGISVDPVTRYLGIEGYDIVWGNEPQPYHPANRRILFAVIWIPLLAGLIVVLLLASYRATQQRKAIVGVPTQLM